MTTQTTKLTFGSKAQTTPANNGGNAFQQAKERALQNKQAQTKADAPKEQVKYWLNIGQNLKYEEPMTDPISGEYILDAEGNAIMEEKEVFVGLDVPIDLESIKVRTNNSNNVFSQALTAAKEQLLEMLLETANTLAEGENTIVNNIDVQIRHAGSNTKVKETAQEHPLLKAFNAKRGQ